MCSSDLQSLPNLVSRRRHTRFGSDWSCESAEALNRTVLTIPHQAGDDGRLFGSVTSQDIVDAIQEARGITIDRRKVNLEEPIRTVGTRMIEVEVEDGVIATVKTMVVEQK